MGTKKDLRVEDPLAFVRRGKHLVLIEPMETDPVESYLSYIFFGPLGFLVILERNSWTYQECASSFPCTQ